MHHIYQHANYTHANAPFAHYIYWIKLEAMSLFWVTDGPPSLHSLSSHFHSFHTSLWWSLQKLKGRQNMKQLLHSSHNIIHIHNNDLWDWYQFYRMLFSLNVESILQNSINPQNIVVDLNIVMPPLLKLECPTSRSIFIDSFGVQSPIQNTTISAHLSNQYNNSLSRTTPIIPISVFDCLELRRAMMSYSRSHFSLTKGQ